MKKKISLILVILLLLVSILGTFCYANEIQPRTGVEGGATTTSDIAPIDNGQNSDTNQTPQYDITYDDLYVFEDKDYEMNQLIDGNAFILVNGNVKFTGEVNGSVYIFANGTVEFAENSYVADALYVFAKDIAVYGEIYDIYAISAQKFELMQNAYISRDIRVVAKDIKLRGTIYRDVYLSAENIDVKDEETELLIGGDFNYTSNNKIENLEDVVLYGETNFILKEDNDEQGPSVAEKIRDYAFSAVTSIIYVLVIYFILILIAPKFVERVQKDLKEKPIISFLVGLVSWVVAVIAFIVSFMLLFTSFGSPITIIAWLLMTIIIYISSAVFSISVLDFVKEKIEKIKENKGLEIGTLAIIALCVWILQKLPFIGGLLSFVIITTGVGLIVRNIIARRDTDNTVTTE